MNFALNESAHLVQAADLALTKSAMPSSVQHNQNVTYTLTVTNNGPGTAVAPTLTDTLPAGQTFVSSRLRVLGGGEPGGRDVHFGGSAADVSIMMTIGERAGAVGTGLTDTASWRPRRPIRTGQTTRRRLRWMASRRRIWR